MCAVYARIYVAIVRRKMTRANGVVIVANEKVYIIQKLVSASCRSFSFFIPLRIENADGTVTFLFEKRFMFIITPLSLP